VAGARSIPDHRRATEKIGGNNGFLLELIRDLEYRVN
jgi:hypothetical protein